MVPVVILFLIARLRLHRAARDQGRPRGSRGRASSSRSASPAGSSTGSTSTRTASSRSTSMRAPGRRPGAPRGDRARRPTSSTPGGSRRSAARSTRSPGVERDVVPGRERRASYTGQCAELCGLEHAQMLASVEVMPQAEFDAWLEASPAEQTPARASSAQETWEGVCAKCHGLHGEGGIGPALAGSPILARSADARDDRPERAAARRCPPSAPAGRRADRRAHRLPDRRTRRVAAQGRDRPSPPGSAAGRELARHDRPQADRDPLHRHVGRLPRPRRR